MQDLRGDMITIYVAQQALADKLAEDHERKVEMVRQAAVEEYTALGKAQAKRIKELEVELANMMELTAAALKTCVESLGTDAKNAVDTLPGDPTDLDKLIWLGKNEYMFRALAFSRPKT